MSAARRTRLFALLAAAAVAVSLLGASGAPAQRAASPKVVSVADFFFSPKAVTIRKGGAVRWVWAKTNSAPHDVHLKQGPQGLKKKGTYSTKTTAVTNARFQKSFPTPGTYKYICTIHPTQMKMTVTVKR